MYRSRSRSFAVPSLAAVARRGRLALLRAGFVLALLLGAVAQPLAAGAQDAPDLPVTPDPAACEVEALDTEDLVDAATSDEAQEVRDSLQATVEAAQSGDAEDEGEEPSIAPLEGDEADAEAVAGVTATVAELYACANGGDIPAIFALFTDAFRGYFLGLLTHGEEEVTDEVVEEVIAGLGEETPTAEEERTTLIAVREVRELGDGRVGALIDHATAGDVTAAEEAGEDVADVVSTDYVVFAEEGDRYLIDAITSDLEDEFGPAATDDAKDDTEDEDAA